MEKRNEMQMIVSGMNDDILKKLFDFLDDGNYDYVGHEVIYYIDEEGRVIDEP